MAKQANVERLELLAAMWNAGTSRDVERIRNKLSDARLSARTTMDALKMAGVDDS